jgi:3alpha(or 20beta)-hydroxysteroid dehydrogenase
MASYAAAKFAVTGLTRSLALELGRDGVRVNAVHPGVIATPLVMGLGEAERARLEPAINAQPIPRLGTPEEIANGVLFFACAESSYCTGSSLVIDGGHIAGPTRQPAG